MKFHRDFQGWCLSLGLFGDVSSDPNLWLLVVSYTIATHPDPPIFHSLQSLALIILYILRLAYIN